jgi:pimeloyl-ACP methyl ester carboxylesterase
MRTLRGLKDLIHDAVDGVTFLVADGQDAVARRAHEAGAVLGLSRPVAAVDRVRAITTDASLASVRFVNRSVQQLTDAALDLAAPQSTDPAPVPLRSDALYELEGAADALIGVLNGVVGDHLSRSDNGLRHDFKLRYRQSWLDLTPERLRAQIPDATDRVVVFVHGLSATETSWCLDAERMLGAADAHYGSLLERDLGVTAVFLRYNSGLPIHDNGARLAAALEALHAHWPVPSPQLDLVGHSMGGLVSHAALDAGVAHGHAWTDHLAHLVTLGSPHQGAPLARAADAASRLLRSIDTPGTQVVGKVLEVRSPGIRDLQLGRGELGLPDDHPVRYAFFAGSLTRRVNPVTKVLGDTLVPVRSAEGPVTPLSKDVYTQRFPGIAHHVLQAHPEVYAALRAFLADET